MTENKFLRDKVVSTASIVLILAAIFPFIIYALTAHREVTWWKNAEYLLVCHDLGVAHPPGSLLTTILGW